MVRLATAAAAAAAVLSIAGCGAPAPQDQGAATPTPAPTQINDRPSGPGGGNPGASPPPFMCGDHLCPSPSPR